MSSKEGIKRDMSQLIHPKELNTSETFAAVIDDATILNSEAMRAALGITNLRHWCAANNVRPVTMGRTWLFTGRTLRAALETQYERKREAEHAKAG